MHDVCMQLCACGGEKALRRTRSHDHRPPPPAKTEMQPTDASQSVSDPQTHARRGARTRTYVRPRRWRTVRVQSVHTSGALVCVSVVVHVCGGGASVRACVCPGRVCPTARWGADRTSFTCVQSMRIGARHEGDPCAWDDTSSSESPSPESSSGALLLPRDAEEEDDEEEPAFDPPADDAIDESVSEPSEGVDSSCAGIILLRNTDEPRSGGERQSSPRRRRCHCPRRRSRRPAASP